MALKQQNGEWVNGKMNEQIVSYSHNKWIPANKMKVLTCASTWMNLKNHCTDPHAREYMLNDSIYMKFKKKNEINESIVLEIRTVVIYRGWSFTKWEKNGNSYQDRNDSYHGDRKVLLYVKTYQILYLKNPHGNSEMGNMKQNLNTPVEQKENEPK